MRRLTVIAATVLTALAAALSAGPAHADSGPPPTGPDEISGPGASLTWMFAEGTTRPGFDEFLLISNPNAAPVNFTATYLVDGGSPIQKTYTIGANARADIKVWTVAGDADAGAFPGVGRGANGQGIDHGTRIDAQSPIVVERAMYMTNKSFDNVPVPVDGATSVFGRSEPQTLWDFAEGTTLSGFQTYYLLSNPSATDLTVNYTLSPQGGAPVTKSIPVPANARRTVIALDDVGAGQTGLFASFASAAPFLAERAVYFSRSISPDAAEEANGAHANFGAIPANEWNLAEGTVLGNWYEFLTLGNPGATDVKVTLNYAFEGTPGVSKSVTVPAGGRATVQVYSDTDPAGVGRSVSSPLSRGVSVQAVASAPFVIERPLYQAGVGVAGLNDVNDGTVASGLPGRPSLSYVFAEGTTLPDFRSFYTFQNPNDADAIVEITYFTDQAEVVKKQLTVPAHSRVTTQIFSTDPGEATRGALALANRGFGAVIQSTNGVSFNVERPIYLVHDFPQIGTVDGSTDVVGRPGGTAVSVAKANPVALVANGGVATSTISVTVFEADALGLSVIDTVGSEPDGLANSGTGDTAASYMANQSVIPSGFTCLAQSGADIVCTAGNTTNAEPGTYTFQLAFQLVNSTGATATVSDTAVVAALNADTSITSGSVRVAG